MRPVRKKWLNEICGSEKTGETLRKTYPDSVSLNGVSEKQLQRPSGGIQTSNRLRHGAAYLYSVYTYKSTYIIKSICIVRIVSQYR